MTFRSLFSSARATCLLSLGTAWLSVLPAAQAQGGAPAVVRVDPVRAEEVRERSFVTGDVRAARRSRVAGREPGLVLESRLADGMRVAQGDLLARIDDRNLQLEKAELLADRAVVAATKIERQADLDLSLWREEAIVALSERGSSFERELRETRAEVAVARARLTQTERQLELMDARVALLDERIADTRIVAPFAAVIVAKSTEAGEWLGVGGTVCELVSVDSMEVWLDVPQTLAAAVGSEDAEIELHVGAIGLRRAVRDFRVIPEADRASRNFPLVVPLEAGATGIKAGMSAAAWVATARASTQLSVHKDAVMRSETGSFVYAARSTTPDAPPVAIPVPVEPRFSHGERLIVRSAGLAEGDLLVIEGNERLLPQVPLAPQRADSGEQAGN